jgi:hypothetical protein
MRYFPRRYTRQETCTSLRLARAQAFPLKVSRLHFIPSRRCVGVNLPSFHDMSRTHSPLLPMPDGPDSPTFANAAAGQTSTDAVALANFKARLQSAGQTVKRIYAQHERYERWVAAGQPRDGAPPVAVSCADASALMADLLPLLTRRFVDLCARHCHAVLRMVRVALRWLSGGSSGIMSLLATVFSIMPYYASAQNAELLDTFGSLFVQISEVAIGLNPDIACDVVDALGSLLAQLAAVHSAFPVPLHFENDAELGGPRLTLDVQSPTDAFICITSALHVLSAMAASASEVLACATTGYSGLADLVCRTATTALQCRYSLAADPSPHVASCLTSVAKCLVASQTDGTVAPRWIDTVDPTAPVGLCIGMVSFLTDLGRIGSVELTAACAAVLQALNFGAADTPPPYEDAEQVIGSLISVQEAVSLVAGLAACLEPGSDVTAEMQRKQNAGVVRSLTLFLFTHGSLRDAMKQQWTSVGSASGATAGSRLVRAADPAWWDVLTGGLLSAFVSAPDSRELRCLFAAMPARLREVIVTKMADNESESNNENKLTVAAALDPEAFVEVQRAACERVQQALPADAVALALHGLIDTARASDLDFSPVFWASFVKLLRPTYKPNAQGGPAAPSRELHACVPRAILRGGPAVTSKARAMSRDADVALCDITQHAAAYMKAFGLIHVDQSSSAFDQDSAFICAIFETITVVAPTCGIETLCWSVELVNAAAEAAVANKHRAFTAAVLRFAATVVASMRLPFSVSKASTAAAAASSTTAPAAAAVPVVAADDRSPSSRGGARAAKAPKKRTPARKRDRSRPRSDGSAAGSDDDVQIVDPPPKNTPAASAVVSPIPSVAGGAALTSAKLSGVTNLMRALFGSADLLSDPAIACALIDALEALLRCAPLLASDVFPLDKAATHLRDIVVRTTAPVAVRRVAARTLGTVVKQACALAPLFDERGHDVDPFATTTAVSTGANFSTLSLSDPRHKVFDPAALVLSDALSAPGILLAFTLALDGHCTPYAARARAACHGALLQAAIVTGAPEARAAGLQALQTLARRDVPAVRRQLLSDLTPVLARCVTQDGLELLALEDLLEVSEAALLVEYDALWATELFRQRDAEGLRVLNAKLEAALDADRAIPGIDAPSESAAAEATTSASAASTVSLARFAGPRVAAAVASLLLDFSEPEMRPERAEELRQRLVFLAEVVLRQPETHLGTVIHSMFKYALSNYLVAFCHDRVPRSDADLSAQFAVVGVAVARLAAVTPSCRSASAIVQSMLGSTSRNKPAIASHAFGLLDILCTGLGVSYETDAGILADFTVAAAPTSRLSGEGGVPSAANQAPTAAPVAYLVAITHLVQLLGDSVGVIALKFPALLTACLSHQALHTQVALAWLVFVRQLRPSELEETAAAFAVDVITAEGRMADPDRPSAAPIELGDNSSAPPLSGFSDASGPIVFLARALQVLHANTKTLSFWKPIATSLRHDSAVVRFVFNEHAPAVHTSSELPLDGFVSGLQSKSATCRAVFSKSLLRCLQRCEAPALYKLCGQPEAEELLQLLLQRLPDEGQQRRIVLTCVSMLGAQRPSARGGAGGDGPELNELDMVLKWEKFVAHVLAHYCVDALATTSDARIHDRAAYAVQRLLRICVNQERTARGRPELPDLQPINVSELDTYDWWCSVPQVGRATLSAFASTTFETKVLFRTERQVPEYRPQMPFPRWLQAFFANCVSRTTGVHGQCFEALRNVAKRQASFCAFLLPFVCLNAVMKGSEQDLAELTIELRTVFAHASMAQEHVQIAFQIYDFVTRFSEDCLRLDRTQINSGKETPEDEAARRGRQRGVTRAKTFLRNLTASERSAAALSVNSAARALKYLESELALPDCNGRQDIQLMFAMLDDTDASRCFHASVAERRDWGATALSHEQCGEYSQALQCCEHHLQRDPDDRGVRNCALRCMKQLGLFNMMSQFAVSSGTGGRAGGGDDDGAVPQSSVRSSSRDAHAQAALDKLSQTLRAADVEAGSTADAVADVHAHAAEAAWRLGRWDELESPTAPPAAKRGLPGALLQLRRLTSAAAKAPAAGSAPTSAQAEVTAGVDALVGLIDRERARIAQRMAGSLSEGYQPSYPSLVALHFLGDLQIAAHAVSALPPEAQPSKARNRLQPLVDVLDARLAMVERTPKAIEVLLALHRAVFGILGLPHLVAERWLVHADVLHDAGLLDPALNAVHHASTVLFSSHCPDDSRAATVVSRIEGAEPVVARYYLTLAKILHESGRRNDAIDFADTNGKNESVPRRVRANLLLKATEWGLEVGMWPPADATTRFRAVLELEAFEGAYQALGYYLDTLYSAAKPDLTPSRDKPVEAREKEALDAIEQYVPSVIEQYGKALKSGRERAYLTLPRLLTCWLDSTKTIASLESPAQRSRGLGINARLNSKVETALLGHDGAPPGLVITALPQLISRLGHVNFDVVNVLTQLLYRLLTAFPQQTLWSLLAVQNSVSGRTRSEYVRQQVLKPYTDLVRHDTAASRAVSTLTMLFKSLIDLCQASSTSLTNQRLTAMPYIKRVADLLPGSSVIMPLESTLTPRMGLLGIASNSNVFASSPTFHTFSPTVTIMASLQKPKKFGAYDENGKLVSFLCKAKDEPRKDMRMMELAALVNDVLRDSPEAKRRQLRLKRYAVTALTDDCALIEWVDGVTPIRAVCDELYQLNNHGLRTSAIRALKEKCDKGQYTQMDLLKVHILPFFPPILHMWLQHQFPHPAAWYNARNSFTRSAACWSMVGHLVGLGDRHGENLLLHKGTGEIMHCDFACMFDKGENLEVPERVRFRLTQNVVDGFGVTGVDGPFRKACELALGITERHRAMIIGLLETFIHDPLVEWTNKPGSSGHSRYNPAQLIARAGRRLDGYLDLYGEPKDTVSLSTEGQVLKLVHNCRSLENLSRMYIWWMPWV